MRNLKLITLLGPTASGKSELAVKLAKYLGNTVIIGCDSTQVYQGLCIGAGSVEGGWLRGREGEIFVYKSIQHMLIGTTKLTVNYSVKHYLEDFRSCIDMLQADTTTEWVILCGGTGYYAQAVLEGWQIPEVEYIRGNLSDWQLRGKYYDEVLKGGRLLSSSDLYNPRRLDGYFSGEVFKKGLDSRLENRGVYMLLPTLNSLDTKITIRLKTRWESGNMWKEYMEFEDNIETIMKKGIEYQGQGFLMLGWVSEEKMLEMIFVKTRQYAKKQLTWLRPKHYTTVVDLQDIINKIRVW